MQEPQYARLSQSSADHKPIIICSIADSADLSNIQGGKHSPRQTKLSGFMQNKDPVNYSIIFIDKRYFELMHLRKN